MELRKLLIVLIASVIPASGLFARQDTIFVYSPDERAGLHASGST